MKTKVIRLLLISGFLPLHFLIFAQNVGIGTLTPSSKLQIIGSADTTQLIIDANNTQSNTHPLIKLRSNSGADLMWIHSDNVSNTFIGFETGKINNAIGGGVYNTFIGSIAGAYNKTGYANTAIGSQALFADTSGFSNTSIGYQSLYSNTSGTGNMAIGVLAGSTNSTGSYNTFIGTEADLASSTQRTNATAIGYNAKVNASNALVLGGTGADEVNVGIGTASPNYDLHIHNSADPARLQFTSPFTGTTTTDGFLIGHNSESGEGFIWNKENESILFGTNNIGRMKILADGKVGIGTGSPNFDLHIHNSSSQAVLQFTSASTGTSAVDGFYVGHNNSTGEALIWSLENQNMRFATNGIERMRILADGKVGIGNSAPAYTLDVLSDANTTALSATSSPIGSLSLNEYYDETAPAAIRGKFTATGGNDGVGVYGSGISTNLNYGVGGVFTGNWYGLVGAGQTGSSAAIYADAHGATNAIYINGNISGTGTNNYTSDARLKKNILPLEEALGAIKQMKPLVYEFKVGEFGSMALPEGKHFGLIAQDLQSIYPQLVIENTFDGDAKEGFKYLGVNYNELIPVLIKGLQEQQQIIEELVARIESLEKK